jgi:hypothetical protein
MYSAVIDQPGSYLNVATPMLRLVLYKGEVCRLPQDCKGIKVLSGNAWVTVTGKDITLAQGEKTSLISEKNFILVSPLRNAPLVFEAWGDSHKN